VNEREDREKKLAVREKRKKIERERERGWQGVERRLILEEEEEEEEEENVVIKWN
jgi:hypothetical protein